MNTKQIKKEAIALCLGDLLTNCCRFSPDTPAAWNSKIEPDLLALQDFVDSVGFMAKLHFHNNLSLDVIKEIETEIIEVGSKCGHIWSDGTTTGTWGVRLGEIHNIRKIMELEDFELLPIGSKVTLFEEYPAKILNYKIDTDWVVVKYEYLNKDYGIQVWEDCIYWKDLENFAKGE